MRKNVLTENEPQSGGKASRRKLFLGWEKNSLSIGLNHIVLLALVQSLNTSDLQYNVARKLEQEIVLTERGLWLRLGFRKTE